MALNLHTRVNASTVGSNFSCGPVWPGELVAHKQAVVLALAQRQLEVAGVEARRRLEQVEVR